MFEELKQSLREAIGRASSPEDNRAVIALMRDAVVEGKLAVASMGEAATQTRARLDLERKAWETARRRGQLAVGINDAETARIAADYETKHAERIAVLQKKLAAQEEEMALAEREIAEMTRQMKAAGAGVHPGRSSHRVPEPDQSEETSRLKREMDRAARSARAEDQLAELKRRMGK